MNEFDKMWIDHYTEAQAKNSIIVNSLVSNFLAKKAAKELGLASYSPTGKIDTKRVKYYKTSNNIFQRKQTLPTGKSHGVFMLVDFSASMDTRLSSVIQQVINIVKFCTKVGIPFEVYSFTSKNVKGVKNDVQLMHLLSSSVGLSSIEAYLQRLWLVCQSPKSFDIYMGSTPTIEAISIIGGIIKKFQTYNSLDVTNFMLITDGEHDNINTKLTNNKFHILNNLSHQRLSITVNDKNTLKHELYSFLISELKRSIQVNTLWIYVGTKSECSGIISKLKLIFGNDEVRPIQSARGFVEMDGVYGFDKSFIIDSEICFSISNTEFGDLSDGTRAHISKLFSIVTSANKVKRLLGLKLADAIIDNM